MRRWKQMMVLPALLLAVLATGWNAKRALAHEGVEIGPYVVEVGWVNEPAIVGERNALFLEITENDEPVTGVETTLDTELLYGGRTLRANLTPTLTPGQYTVEIFPTIRGQYTVRLFGAIGDTEVDAIVEPEEVFSAERIQFPEPLPDARALQAQIAGLESRLQTAQLIAIGGAAAGLLGVAVGFVALRRPR